MFFYITVDYNASTGIYNLYIFTPHFSPYVCLIYGTERHRMIFDQNTYLTGGFAKLSEGETLEIHAVNGSWSNDYHQSICTAASGSVTAVEHNATTVINVIEE